MTELASLARVNWSQGHESVKTGHALLICHVMGKRKMLPSLIPQHLRQLPLAPHLPYCCGGMNGMQGSCLITHSSPLISVRAGPVDMKTQEQVRHLTCCSTWESVPCTSGPQGSYLSCCSVGKGEMLWLPAPGGKVVPWVMRVEELTLPLTDCSPRENMPSTPPSQHRSSDPVGGGEVRKVEELALYPSSAMWWQG